MLARGVQLCAWTRRRDILGALGDLRRVTQHFGRDAVGAGAIFQVGHLRLDGSALRLELLDLGVGGDAAVGGRVNIEADGEAGRGGAGRGVGGAEVAEALDLVVDVGEARV